MLNATKFQEIATDRGVTSGQIALACAVSSQTVYRWLSGEAIGEEYAAKLGELFSPSDVAQIFAAARPRLGSGRRARDGGKQALRSAARELRARGKADLARAVTEEAER